MRHETLQVKDFGIIKSQQTGGVRFTAIHLLRNVAERCAAVKQVPQGAEQVQVGFLNEVLQCHDAVVLGFVPVGDDEPCKQSVEAHPFSKFVRVAPNADDVPVVAEQQVRFGVPNNEPVCEVFLWGI